MNRIYKLRYILCGLAGALTALSFSYKACMWIVFISLTPLFIVFLNPDFTLKKRQNILCMLFFSLFYYGFSIKWLDNIQVSETSIKIKLIIVIGIILLSLLMGLYWGITVIFYSSIRNGKFSDVISFSLLFVLGEWLQEICYPIAFPWARIGVIPARFSSFIQSASLLGSLFITFLILVINGLWIFAFYHRKQPRIFLKTFLYLFIIFAVNLTYGNIRIHNYERDKDNNSFNASLIQTNLVGEEKWNYDDDEILKNYLNLAQQTVTQNTDIVIFPETALTFYFFEDDAKSKQLLDFAYKNDVTLIIGTRYRENELKYNSMLAISPDGTLSDIYSKQVLVPFGEYIPFKADFLQNIISGVFDKSSEYTAGTNAIPIETSIGKIGGIICYESIFPEIARKSTLSGAEVLAVISNDSWFGETSAINQHYCHSIMRAVENGRYLLRCSSTAISSVISPYGKEISTAPPFTTIGVNGSFEMIKNKTLFSYVGDIIVLPASIIYIISFLKSRKK